MIENIVKLFENGGGEFVSPPLLFSEKLKKVKLIIFDWDGVFNDGFKRGEEGSIFSEVDAMGTNMLRYALWKHQAVLPIAVVITGENNPASRALAQREHFHEVISLSKNKVAAFDEVCKKYNVRAEEVLFFFDDVLDLEVARRCGARVMIGSLAAPMLSQFAKSNAIADYITAMDGGRHGLREGCELVIGLLGLFDHVISNRMIFSEEYQQYLAARQAV